MKNTLLTASSQTSAPVKKQRDSNLELYRIITMLFIIAHHYVVNSGLTGDGGPIHSDYLSAPSLFLLMFGAFGKTGINCFVLISGYFMCKSQITARKYAKLLGQVVFYNVLFTLLFWVTGYAPLTPIAFLFRILPVTSVTQDFTSCYLLFFLCIPFLNLLIQRMTQKQHLYLIALLSFIYILMGTLPRFYVSMNYVSWFAVLYFIASYIRLYPAKLFVKTALWGFLTLFFIAVSLISVVVCSWLSKRMGSFVSYAFVVDSNTLLAVLTGISSFLFFKNLKLRPSRFINLISSTTFGVLLIHAASDDMRRWLWQDVLNNVEMFESKFMPLHAVGSVLAVFAVCSAIDLLRIRFIEKPSLRLWDKYFDRVKNRFLSAEKKLCDKLNISSGHTGEEP